MADLTRTPQTLLYRLCHQPSERDWERFVLLFTPLLHRWVRRFGMAESDAEDLVQEMFLLLWGQLPRFRYDPARSFRAWLWTVCRRMTAAWKQRQHPIAIDNCDSR